ncbi:Nop8p [Sugiyamaella lignohabitans]|uniref:Nop8p n=1 Tax=Sugiyamaella lignohabitans TaxID=796027 RepID=A0A167E1J8_9ASCO|nr:Nop8p [Sugiyamaella lignohabitans]ANB13536.1 Nop8p [Sugiyamaella lignohabitans]
MTSNNSIGEGDNNTGSEIMDVASHIRIHIGSISQSLANKIDKFETRIQKYGEVIKPLELHKKPALDTYFAFITLNATPSQLNSFKKAFNGAKFMGSTLSVGVAKQDYTERLEQERKEQERIDSISLLSHDQLKRLYSRQRPQLNFRDHVIHGRERTTKRKNLRYATYRITKFNKEGKKVTVQLRCKKTKLWGFQKDKTLDALVYRYTNGQWKDGNGDTIEVTNIRLPRSIMTSNTSLLDNEEDEDAKEDREKNLKIFEQMFGDGMDFVPKPMKYNDDDEDEEEPADDQSKASTTETDESDFEDLIASQEAFGNEPEHTQESSKFQSGPAKEVATADDEEVLPTEGTTTSALRSLFNPSQDNTGFSLFGGDDDENEGDETEDIIMHDPVETTVVRSAAMMAPVPLAPLNERARGLFFAHSDSPFLHSQSQVAQLKSSTFNGAAWEEEFWSKRGEWNRELRRHRRDVLRQLKKKNQGKRAIL